MASAREVLVPPRMNRFMALLSLGMIALSAAAQEVPRQELISVPRVRIPCCDFASNRHLFFLVPAEEKPNPFKFRLELEDENKNIKSIDVYRAGSEVSIVPHIINKFHPKAVAINLANHRSMGMVLSIPGQGQRLIGAHEYVLYRIPLRTLGDALGEGRSTITLGPTVGGVVEFRGGGGWAPNLEKPGKLHFNYDIQELRVSPFALGLRTDADRLGRRKNISLSMSVLGGLTQEVMTGEKGRVTPSLFVRLLVLRRK